LNAQEILQQVQTRTAPMSPAEVRKILDTIRSDAERQINAVLIGVMMHHRAHTLAQELEVAIGDAEATAQTMSNRFAKLQQQVDNADYAVRKTKADKIMLPSGASPSDLAQADQAIQAAERALLTAKNNLRAAKQTAEQRQRELEDLRAVHRSLSAVGMPDLAPIKELLDAVR
jgi:DNA repair exonuclease SbcCD ATPase subunit